MIPPAVPFAVIARALIARLSTVTSSQLGILRELEHAAATRRCRLEAQLCVPLYRSSRDRGDCAQDDATVGLAWATDAVPPAHNYLGKLPSDMRPRLCDCFQHADAKALRAASCASQEIVRITPENKWRAHWDVGIERAILMSLCSAENAGNGWELLDGWGSDRPVGDWHGVKTNSEGFVCQLICAHSNLRGRVLPALGNLVHLTDLVLNHNQLHGPSNPVPRSDIVESPRRRIPGPSESRNSVFRARVYATSSISSNPVPP